MIFSLDVCRARKGDCMLLHYGTKQDPGLIMIDGGPSQVYGPHLKPRLKAIQKARGLANETLPVDLLMVSHIDDDHIKGILELANELIPRKEARQKLWLRVKTLWHNTFDDIIGNPPKELLAALTTVAGQAAVDGGDPDVEGLELYDGKVLASVKQGFDLRNAATKLNWPVNRQFGGKLVMAGAETIDMERSLTFVVAGPLQKELIKLHEEHEDFLKEKAKKGAAAALASFTDTSITNLSSIVVLAKAGGKSMLLTGDARGDKILDGLEEVGGLQNGRLHVDILKMPHHGSDRNMKQSFLEVVTADHYVFSGNGEHGNPERETLEMLRLARGTTAGYTVHLTYPLQETDAEREEDWNKERAKELAKNKPVRAEWSHAAHSLTAYFAQHPDMAARLKIADPDRHVIDLLDELEV